MISEFIFTTLRDNVTGLQNGIGYNIYPKKVPDGIDFERAVVYNRISGTPVYTLLGTDVQITCVARTYGDCENLSLEVVKAFQNKKYQSEGDMLNTEVTSIVDLPQDTESDYYLVAVTVYIKTRKSIV